MLCFEGYLANRYPTEMVNNTVRHARRGGAPIATPGAPLGTVRESGEPGLHVTNEHARRRVPVTGGVPGYREISLGDRPMAGLRFLVPPI